MNHTGYATLADMQAYQFGALYLQGDELKKRWVNTGPTGSQVQAKPGTASMTTLTSATKPHGKNGGARNGSVPTSVITTTLALMI
jgi:alpha-amylase